jgi:tetratricopeptide (TPR) repeat protein
MRQVTAVLVLLLALASTHAQDQESDPDTPGQAAEKVLGAIGAKDDAALKSLGERDEPDPWLVADELCRRGEYEAARAFAGTSPRATTVGLAEYVAGLVGKVDSPDERELHGRVERALKAKDWSAILAAGEAELPALETVPRIRIAHGRGIAQLESGSLEAAEATFERVAAAAKRLGWISFLARARHNVGVVCWRRKDYRSALEHFERALARREKVGDAEQTLFTLKGVARSHQMLGDASRALALRRHLLALGGDLYWPARNLAQAADLVLAAVEAADSDALGAFARNDHPDPWLVVDELVARGAQGGALAYARATSGRDTEGLPAYLDSELAAADGLLRDGLRKLATLSRAKDVEGVLAAVEKLGAGSGGLVSVRLEAYRGWALYQIERYAESSGAYRDAADLAKRLGWLRKAATSLYSSGLAAEKASDLTTALARRRERLAVEEEREDQRGVGRALHAVGGTLSALGEHAEAAAFFERAVKVKEELADREGLAASLAGLGISLGRQKDHAGALAAYERAAAIREELGDRSQTAALLRSIGNSCWRLEDWEKAREAFDREAALRVALEDRRGEAVALRGAGIARRHLMDFAAALPLHERALAIWRELGDRPRIAEALADIGGLYHGRLADYLRALSHYERSLAISTELDDRPAMAETLFSIGHLHMFLGDYATVLTYLDRSLAIREELEDRLEIARMHLHIGFVHQFLGDWSKTLSCAERALAMARELGDPVFETGCLSELGAAHNGLEEHERALECFEEVLACARERGDRRQTAVTLERIGDVHESRGDLRRAVEFHQRSLAIWEELDPYWMGVRLQRIAEFQRELGELEPALSNLERSLEVMEELGNRFGQTAALMELGKVHAALGDHGTAVRYLDRAVRLARRIRTREALVLALRDLAQVRLDAGEHALSLASAQQALTELEILLGGLAEGESTTGRERFADIYGIGTLAAVRLEDPFAALEFLENGRAGALLETLGGGRAALLADLPPDLVREEAVAKAEEARARGNYDQALDAGDRRAMQMTAQALDAAMERRRAVAARMQREAKRVAEVFYPRAAPLEEIQDWMEEGTALVVYGLCLEEALALVVRPKGERIVALGTVEEVEAACSVLACETATADAAPALEALRKLLVEPLGLADDVESVLVSPDGPLGYLPWAALLDRQVACVPSGTTWVVLREEERGPGSQVLALGDPSYGSRPGDRAVAVYRGGALQPLPATRAEAAAVGDVVLLGEDATETGFAAALETVRRWRAVHIACHGLLDSEKPLRSSLALTPGDGNDGFLTFLDVFGLEIPADLVVLSACETARGKVARAEGIVGLTRAFMYAGSPRVLCSLWKVDDEATKALMVKFYELWNPTPESGRQALPAATALKQAQEFVRSHEKWEHPFYWAAWVLWGLPE